MDMAGIEPCPFCGNEFLNSYSSMKGFYVACAACGTDGPSGNNIEEAKEKWNKRIAFKPSPADFIEEIKKLLKPSSEQEETSNKNRNQIAYLEDKLKQAESDCQWMAEHLDRIQQEFGLIVIGRFSIAQCAIHKYKEAKKEIERLKERMFDLAEEFVDVDKFWFCFSGKPKKYLTVSDFIDDFIENWDKDIEE